MPFSDFGWERGKKGEKEGLDAHPFRLCNISLMKGPCAQELQAVYMEYVQTVLIRACMHTFQRAEFVMVINK